MNNIAINNPVRTQLLMALAELSVACPEMRFGQLVSNLSTLAKGLSGDNQWDVEDEELLQAARQQLEYFTEHRDPNGSVVLGSAAQPRA